MAHFLTPASQLISYQPSSSPSHEFHVILFFSLFSHLPTPAKCRIELSASDFRVHLILAYFCSSSLNQYLLNTPKTHSLALLKPMSSFSSLASSPMQGDCHSSHPSPPSPTAFYPATFFSDSSMEEMYVPKSDPTHFGGYSLVQVEIWEGVSQLYYYFLLLLLLLLSLYLGHHLYTPSPELKFL